MAWLHEAGICHLDLKPSNILIDRHEVLKVADFGYSRLLPETRLLLIIEENLAMGGSPIYMASLHKSTRLVTDIPRTGTRTTALKWVSKAL
jgi:serine/threonine protein kinase